MDVAQTLLIGAIPILLAVSLHEAAHGLVAYWLGDSTAKQLGRLTANPLKHIDPVGTILVPILMVVIIGLPFGWAKPVPVDIRNFVNPLKDMALVAVAGPASNFFMAVFWTLTLVVFNVLPNNTLTFYLEFAAVIGIQVNLVLMVLNLLPIPPLDGGRIVTGVLPLNIAQIFARFEMIGMWVVIFLLASGILGKILGPMVMGIQKQLLTFFGL